MIKLGQHKLTEKQLNTLIINKIPKTLFSKIIKQIEKELDKGKQVTGKAIPL